MEKKRKKIHKKALQKKIKLGKEARRAKWAPFWAVLKKYGLGKRVHPSRITRIKRSWRRTKLHIKPRISKISHKG